MVNVGCCTEVLLVDDVDDSKAVAASLTLSDRESLLCCKYVCAKCKVKCYSDVPVPSNYSFTLQMSELELEIVDDHPLALELSSLRTAVARFQVSLQLL